MPRLSTLFLLLSLSILGHTADGWQYAVPATAYQGHPCKFHLWMPDKQKPVRAAFIFVPHGSYGGYSISEHLRNLARSLDCAIILSDKGLCSDDGDPKRVLDSLNALAKVSGHPEIANIPLFVFGHSNSTQTMGEFAHQVPERIVAWVAMKSAFGGQFEYPELAKIPGMVVCGENDHSYFQDQLATVKRMRREHHALVHIIVESEGPHWPVESTFAIQGSFLRHAFYRRVPFNADATLEPPQLLSIDERSGCLGQNLEGTRVLKVENGNRSYVWDRAVTVKTVLEYAAFDDYPGDAAEASWLLSPGYAQHWQDYCASLSTRHCNNVAPALIAAWKASREVHADNGLSSDILPDISQQLRTAKSYKSAFKSLRKIAADTEKESESAEAERLLMRLEEMATERLLQAQRLEDSNMATAISAYQRVIKRFSGSSKADEAKARLSSKEFRNKVALHKQLAHMHHLTENMKAVGTPIVTDQAFVKANSAALKQLQSIGNKLISSNESACAKEAQSILERYGIPIRH